MWTASAPSALGSSRADWLPQSSYSARRAVCKHYRRPVLVRPSVAEEHSDALVAINSLSRRAILSVVVASLTGPSLALEGLQNLNPTQSLPSQPREDTPDYSKPGPFKPVRLPRLEHICSECFPRCIGDQCLLRLDVTYPKASKEVGFGGPYPLAILTSGYLVGCDAYQSYAERLASWGYTAVLYDKIESVTDTLNDEVSARMVTDIIDWCQFSPLMQQIADTQRVYLVGHSRGGKISCLAAAGDPRVAALCLIDPVDVTVYAPLGPGFPSAVSALQHISPDRELPLAVVGAGLAGDCVPKQSNYSKFFESVPSAAWEVVVQNAGHFQFLDYQSALQRAVCPQGSVSEPDVRTISQAVMVAWAEIMVRNRPQANLASYTSSNNPYMSMAEGAISLDSPGPRMDASEPVVDGAKAVTGASGRASSASSEVGSPVRKLSSPVSNLSSPISNLSSPISNLSSPISKLSSPSSELDSPVSKFSSGRDELSSSISKLSTASSELSSPISKLSSPSSELSSPVGKLSSANSSGQTGFSDGPFMSNSFARSPNYTASSVGSDWGSVHEVPRVMSGSSKSYHSAGAGGVIGADAGNGNHAGSKVSDTQKGVRSVSDCLVIEVDRGTLRPTNEQVLDIGEESALAHQQVDAERRFSNGLGDVRARQVAVDRETVDRVDGVEEFGSVGVENRNGLGPIESSGKRVDPIESSGKRVDPIESSGKRVDPIESSGKKVDLIEGGGKRVDTQGTKDGVSPGDESGMDGVDAMTARRTLESLLTHLQYQTTLSVSSRFRNL